MGEGGKDFWTPTIETLGKIVKKPALVEKLLVKPPFRFLHDVITAVQRATTFPEGLFTEEELDSAKLDDKDKRGAFLQKAIDVTAAASGERLGHIKVNKILAGMEPEMTNEWLVALAKAAQAPPDKQAEAVARVKASSGGGGSGGGAKEEKKEKDRDKDRDKDREKDRDKDRDREKDREKDKDRGDRKERDRDRDRDKEKEGKDKDRDRDRDREKDKDRDRDRDKDKDKDRDRDRDRKDRDKDKDRDRDRDRDRDKDKDRDRKRDKDRDRDAPLKAEGGGAAPPAAAADEPATALPPRPPTAALKAPPVVKSHAIQSETAPEGVSKQARASGVIAEGGGASKEDASDDDNAAALAFEAQMRQDVPTSGATAGYLSKIAADSAARPKVVVEHAEDGETGIVLGRGLRRKEKDSFDVEVGKLREALQSLVRTTNPLGKAMEYISEDLDEMTQEYTRLKRETAEQEISYNEQRRITDDLLAPLQVQLHEVEEQTADQFSRITAQKAAILRQDDVVDKLLRMVVMNEE